MVVATPLELGDPDVSFPRQRDGRLETELDKIEAKQADGDKYRSEESSDKDIYVKDGAVDLKGRPSIRSKSGGWRACPFILGNECCERLAYYGIGTNLVVYLTSVLHQGNAAAANNVTNWSGTAYITPLIGAFFADAYWGRYWTIATFSTIYCLGMVLLTLSASVHSLKPPPCLSPQDDSSCKHASTTQLAVFYLALYMIALGTGGIKPCVSSFGADQFDDEDPAERKKKTSFFNWFYFSINVGALVSSSVLVYIQDNVSWAWGFGVPAVAMGIAIVSFFIGTPRYRHQKPGGSPLSRIAQVFVAAVKKWRVELPSNHKLLYETNNDQESIIQGSRKVHHTQGFRFLDKAAVVDVKGGISPPSPWKLCTVTQVEEVKIIIRILPIWASSIVFSTVYSQMSTLFVEQGATMDLHMGPHFKIPPAALSIFDTLSVIVWVPIYDRLLVPFVRRFTGNERGFTQLQRMGIGLFISMLSMVVAAIVEIKRLQVAKHHGLLDDTTTPVPMSIFWQVPQYFLVGASEIFTFIGQIEFFYDQSPDAMRSMGSALSLTTVALGNYLSTLLVTIIAHVTTHGGSLGWIPNNLNRGHIDYFFWLLAVLSGINILFYLACANWYKYKKPVERKSSK
ncbi:hypothetical protein O6H91_08G031400 [Diphasiastrum complanatum]|uniref:Uncharacterized protein n=1 Tax=Diphasiastrum complanatum TaxID=34168 RepID=A0ACC2CW94_DIPCM|nr:hypothetical protein O6H91_08G031400 [Diphasiastrum complanatum]